MVYLYVNMYYRVMYTIYIEYTTNIPIMLVMINLISALGDENLELNTS